MNRVHGHLRFRQLMLFVCLALALSCTARDFPPEPLLSASELQRLRCPDIQIELAQPTFECALDVDYRLVRGTLGGRVSCSVEDAESIDPYQAEIVLIEDSGQALVDVHEYPRPVYFRTYRLSSRIDIQKAPELASVSIKDEESGEYLVPSGVYRVEFRYRGRDCIGKMCRYACVARSPAFEITRTCGHIIEY